MWGASHLLATLKLKNRPDHSYKHVSKTSHTHFHSDAMRCMITSIQSDHFLGDQLRKPAATELNASARLYSRIGREFETTSESDGNLNIAEETSLRKVSNINGPERLGT